MDNTKKNYIYDLEVLKGFFCAVFKNESETDYRIFEISYRKNEIKELKQFLLNGVDELGGYNNLAYDSQIIEYILRSKTLTPLQIYEFSQKVIESEKAIYWESTLKIPQRDIFKILHFDNKAKSTSLKWVEYSLDLNIEDMDCHHSQEFFTNVECDGIIHYCINDVSATVELFNRSASLIELREVLSNQFNIDLKNKSETSMAKEIILAKLSEIMKIDKEKLRKLKTPRSSIKGDSIIPKEVTFSESSLKDVLTYMKSHDFVNDFKYVINYKGMIIDYGSGGIHGCAKSGVYVSTDKYVIKTADVTSYYPFLIMNYGFVPEHLDKTLFLSLYRWFFDERKKYSKKDPLNYVWKLCLNSLYGNLGSEHSFCYDPKQLAGVCVTGQLLLSMLIEKLSIIPDSKLLMANTDGLEIMIPRKYDALYNQICIDWEKNTGFMLEQFEYSKLIIRDINNYIAQFTDGSTKCKGMYEYEDLLNKKVAALHKNKSAVIIPIAVYNYFINGIPVEETIGKHEKILDFCIGKRAKSNSEFYLRKIKDFKIVHEKLPKTIRYYITKNGEVGVKKIDAEYSFMHKHPLKGKSYKIKILNDPSIKTDISEIDKSYYISNANKEITSIKNGETLFETFDE